MDCGRCGEPILPGLTACIACGLGAGESIPTPVSTAPRVRTQNPLARRQPSRAEDAARRAGATVTRWRAGLGTLDFTGIIAAFRGIAPGLGPALRRDWRRASLQLGGALLAGALLAGTWTSPWNRHAWMLFTCLIASFAATEARASLSTPEPGRTVAGILFGIAALFACRLALLTGLAAYFPSVDIGGTARLMAGTYYLRPTTHPQTGMLVGIDLHPVGFFPPAQVAVAPIVATEGQTASIENGEILVDGEPAPNPTMTLARVVALPQQPVTARPGTVILFLPPRLIPTAAIDVPDEMMRSYQPRLTLVPAREVLGEVVYRWLPAESRGRVIWPPAE